MKIIECPRDAMQGIESFIPTELKAQYINQLLKVGFDTIDFGSFVSPKAVPQMRDTADVLKKLDLSNTKTRLLAIVANLRGARDACNYSEIDFLGYPISISETFQIRNVNSTIAESFNTLNEIQELCINKGKTLVAYISMGFGNPYGDPYEDEIVLKFTDVITSLEINTISLSDTIGVAKPKAISSLYTKLTGEFPESEIGCHLHSTPLEAREKIKAAYQAGCRRMDGALKGYGGCPMAADELTGNLATEQILDVLTDLGASMTVNREALNGSLLKSSEVFS